MCSVCLCVCECLLGNWKKTMQFGFVIIKNKIKHWLHAVNGLFISEDCNTNRTQNFERITVSYIYIETDIKQAQHFKFVHTE